MNSDDLARNTLARLLTPESDYIDLSKLTDAQLDDIIAGKPIHGLVRARHTEFSEMTETELDAIITGDLPYHASR